MEDFIIGESTNPPPIAGSTEPAPEEIVEVFEVSKQEESNTSLITIPQEDSKKKPKVTPAEVNEIKALFISGESMKNIMEKYRLSSANWIYDRAERENWWAEKNAFLEKKNKLYLDTVLEGQLDSASKIIEELKAIQKGAIDPIIAGELAPQKYSEASSAYMDAIDLERKLKTEAIHLKFIQDIAQILKEEIQDKDLLLRISVKLRILMERRQENALKSRSSNE